jgi:endoglucanase
MLTPTPSPQSTPPRFVPPPRRTLVRCVGLGAILAPLVFVACGSDENDTVAPGVGGSAGSSGAQAGASGQGTGKAGAAGQAGQTNAGGKAGQTGQAGQAGTGGAQGGSAGTTSASGGGGYAGDPGDAGSAGESAGGSAGNASAGSAGNASAGSAGNASAGSAGNASAGSAGNASAGSGGTGAAGIAGAAGAAGTAGGAGATNDVFYTGVNLSGGEYVKTYPGKHGTNYIYPRTTDYDYFIDKGLKTFRVPFRWEQFQPDLAQPVREDEIKLIKTSVDYAISKGATVVLDPHNYARYRGKIIDSGDDGAPTAAQFAAFWAKLAALWPKNPQVVFGLMNEPFSLGDGGLERWLATVNTTIAAIRKAGATNLILVPGTSWTGAHSWISSKNASIMIGVKDSANNYAYEMHQYLDSDSSGQHDTCVSATVGSQRLKAATDWLRTNKRKAFIGEYAGSNNDLCRLAIDDILTFVDQNRDVWIGWTWWTAGAWVSGADPFNMQPDKGVDRPQLDLLLKHL